MFYPQVGQIWEFNSGPDNLGVIVRVYITSINSTLIYGECLYSNIKEFIKGDIRKWVIRDVPQWRLIVNEPKIDIYDELYKTLQST